MAGHISAECQFQTQGILPCRRFYSYHHTHYEFRPSSQFSVQYLWFGQGRVIVPLNHLPDRKKSARQQFGIHRCYILLYLATKRILLSRLKADWNCRQAPLKILHQAVKLGQTIILILTHGPLTSYTNSLAGSYPLQRRRTRIIFHQSSGGKWRQREGG